MQQNDDDDKQAFLEAMAGVKPLSKALREEAAQISATNKTPKRKRVVSVKPLPSLPTVAAPKPYLPEVDAETTLSYQHSSINPNQWQRFRQGKYPVELRLDLHGLTLLQAEQTVERLMLRAQETGAQHLLIIHGKGSHDGKSSPTLKNWLWRWLRDCTLVLAIHSAPKTLGGTGAVCVWLKKVRGNAVV